MQLPLRCLQPQCWSSPQAAWSPPKLPKHPCTKTHLALSTQEHGMQWCGLCGSVTLLKCSRSQSVPLVWYERDVRILARILFPAMEYTFTPRLYDGSCIEKETVSQSHRSLGSTTGFGPSPGLPPATTSVRFLHIIGCGGMCWKRLRARQFSCTVSPLVTSWANLCCQPSQRQRHHKHEASTACS